MSNIFISYQTTYDINVYEELYSDEEGNETKENADTIQIYCHTEKPYVYMRSEFMNHLSAYKKHPVYGTIRQVPFGYWISCKDPSVLSDYMTFVISESRTIDDMTCGTLHCYNKEQFDTFMSPGLVLQFTPLENADFETA